MAITLTRPSQLTRKALMVLGASLILALSAQLTIPLLPVPVTFQTMALFALAIFLGPQLTFFAALAYLLEGASGLPVFAEFNGGLHTLLGPTGGYLMALPFAGLLAGLIGYQQSFVRVLLAGFLSSLIILTGGTLFLSTMIGLQSAFNYGFKPFILIESIKILAVAFGVQVSKQLTKNSD